MHHALRLQEILFNVFSHYASLSDLASLSRTCRAFKDPALDVLWEDLHDLSPLEKCLPHPSHALPPHQAEWDNLRSYTRRIRSIADFRRGLDENSFKILANPPTAEALFPNLLYLRCRYKFKSIDLLHLPLPSLLCLDVGFKDPHWFQDTLQLIPKSSPNITTFSLVVFRPDVGFSQLVSSCICQWRNLQTVICPTISLDVDAIVHLSHMPALIRLDFALSATLPAAESFVFFSTIQELTVTSKSLDSVLRLFSWIRLSASADIAIIIIDSVLSRREYLSFLAAVQTFNVGHTLQGLAFCQSYIQSNVVRVEDGPLRFEDLRPCTTFSNLLGLEIDLPWTVNLTDGELIELASEWPQLERILINTDWGWNSQGGITLRGLVELLRACRSLSQIGVSFDTRGYTEVSQCPTLPSLESPAKRKLCINVLDSVLEGRSVAAVAAFFVGIAHCYDSFSLRAWECEYREKPPGWEVYKRRWRGVHARAEEAVGLP